MEIILKNDPWAHFFKGGQLLIDCKNRLNRLAISLVFVDRFEKSFNDSIDGLFSQSLSDSSNFCRISTDSSDLNRLNRLTRYVDILCPEVNRFP